MSNRWAWGLAIFLFGLPLALHAEEGGLEKFISREGKYLALLPKSPQTKTTSATTAAGPVKVVSTGAELGMAHFSVVYCDYPAEKITNPDPQVKLDGARKGLVTNTKGTLVSEKKLTFGKAKFPGREMVLVSTEGKYWLRTRIYLAGNRLYQTIAVGASEQEIKSKIAETFLDSFTLLD
jgi:hypothetical protein